MSPCIVLLSFCLTLLVVPGSYGRKPIGTKLDLSNVVNPDPEATEANSRAEMQGENPDLIEGDMLGVKGKDGSVNRNAMADENKQWPQGVVPYTLDISVQWTSNKQQIQAAIDDFHKYTCVKWVPRQQEEDYAEFRGTENGCFAWLGRMGGKQPINLSIGCWDKGTVLHEMLHTTGFAHEQSRSDRDDHITVHYDNIPKEWHDQFRKLRPNEENNMGFPYDYSSVMHYEGKSFSNGAGPSMTTRDPKDQNKLGQRAGFSKQDIQEVNRYYKCQGKTSGIGGINGCSDRNGTFCAENQGLKNGWNVRCDFKFTQYHCPKSCGLCGDKAGKGGPSGSGGSGGGGSSSCEDNDRKYCQDTLGLSKGVNRACDSPHHADYCKKSCRKC